jgi:hypothetical protein
MTRRRWRERLIRAREGHEFTRVDTIAIGLMGLGVVAGVAGLAFDAPAPGFILFVVGFLTLVRHMPGSP